MIPYLLSHTEIDDLDLTRLPVQEHHILGLQVQVHDALGMEVVDALEDLRYEYGGLLLRQELLVADVLEELAARHQLHHQDDLAGRLEHVVQVDDVLVSELGQDLDLLQDLLAEQALATVAVGLALRDELARVLLARCLLDAASYDRKLSISQFLMQLIRIQELICSNSHLNGREKQRSVGCFRIGNKTFLNFF